MFFNLMGNSSAKSLERSLDAVAFRSQLLSQNVANVNTPNYKRSDLDFQSVLQAQLGQSTQATLAMTTTDSKHLNPVQPNLPPLKAVQDNLTSSRQDGNNVDVEYEMAQVEENSLYYQSLINAWKKEDSNLRMAIEGRS